MTLVQSRLVCFNRAGLVMNSEGELAKAKAKPKLLLYAFYSISPSTQSIPKFV